MTLQAFKNKLYLKSNMTLLNKEGRKTMKQHSIKCLRGFLKQLNDEWIECKLTCKKLSKQENDLDNTLKELCKDLHISIELN